MTTKRRMMMANGGKLPKQSNSSSPEKRPYIPLEDHLSKMNGDCIRDVLERLDHNDLDEVATLSERMSKISDLSRSRAVKLEAAKLNVHENGAHAFAFSFDYSRRTYYLSMSNVSDRSVKMKTSRHNHPVIAHHGQKKLTNEEILNHAARIFARFGFKSCKFKMHCEDRLKVCLPLIKNVISARNGVEIEIDISVKKLDAVDKEYLTTMLLDAKPSALNFSFTDFINEKFMEDFVNSVRLPSLTVQYFYDQSFTIRDDRRFVNDIFPRFKTLDMQHMLVNTQFVMAPLLERLRHGKSGKWRFRMPTKLKGSTIKEAAMAAGMTCATAAVTYGSRYMIRFMKITPIERREVSVDINIRSAYDLTSGSLESNSWRIEADFI